MAQSQNEIKFLHFRVPGFAGVDPRGGMTTAYVVNADGSISFAHAVCSHKDNFERATGRAIAKHRLYVGQHEYFGTITGLSEKDFAATVEFQNFVTNGLVRKYSRKRKSK